MKQDYEPVDMLPVSNEESARRAYEYFRRRRVHLAIQQVDTKAKLEREYLAIHAERARQGFGMWTFQTRRTITTLLTLGWLGVRRLQLWLSL